MAAVIAAGEIGFWVFIAAGLLARYLLKLRRTSLVLLAMTPVIDVVVLVATVLDLSHGGKGGMLHGLAAVYLGFSVVFGPAMIRWADVRFAYRFAGGPKPVKPRRTQAEKERYEWREWGKCVLACGIAAGVLVLLIFVVGSPEQTKPLQGWLPRMGVVTAFWFVFGPLWQLLSPKEEKVGS
ncbi:hypothetical protein SAMN05421504_105139 [Amycolatopsis xylanica]|uniref:Uncharacterized protein n=1 Tax=Amycolatopsis xylanica TaxID=589385 RepID=A0A1H3IVQ0_9PSEU|nr:hypothetical protein [Amycolatopsis xylanica]SDY31810.1 hypothetical protein SAMN05421504_105139 [Amycolatopsis xylanica]